MLAFHSFLSVISVRAEGENENHSSLADDALVKNKYKPAYSNLECITLRSTSNLYEKEVKRKGNVTFTC
jgi:hypothetical protein